MISAPIRRANEERASLHDVERSRTFNHVNKIIKRTIEAHASVLVTQKRKLVTRDAYGNEIVDRWREEIAYFRTNVVQPAIDTEISPAALSGVRFDSQIESQIEDTVRREIARRDSSAPMDVSLLNPKEFELLCADLLGRAGWDAQVVAGAGDQGVDVVARRDNITAVFQCKLYSSPLGNTPVQEVHTGRAFYDADIAAVVSNADYTKGAHAAAAQTGVRLLHYTELERFDGVTP